MRPVSLHSRGGHLAQRGFEFFLLPGRVHTQVNVRPLDVSEIQQGFFNRLKLSESNNEIMCQQLSPYADWSLFKAIESKFISKFSNQPVIGIAFYGLALVIANDVFRRQQVRRKLPC